MTLLRGREAPVRLASATGYLTLSLALVGALIAGRAEAGLAEGLALVGLASAVPFALVSRIWRLPAWLLITSAAVPLSIVIIGAVGDGGWFGAARATRFGWALVLLLAVVAWARTPGRRTAVLVGALALVGDQFAVGWFAWWGGGTPERLMLGSFSWHNQFAAYMLIGAAAAIVIAVLHERTIAFLGGVVFVLASVGVLASGSRAALAMLLAAVVVSGVLGVRARGAVALGRWAPAVAAAIGANFFFTSALFFPAAQSAPAQGLLGRGSAEGSWVARLDHWRVALEMGGDSWLLGSGLSTYGLRSDCFDREYYTSNPHNEWLLAWAEGGVVMAAPLTVLLVAAILLTVRSLRVSWRPDALLDDPARWAALVAMVMALGHAAFDFDWAYPLLIVLAALVAAVAAAPLVAMRATGTRATTVIAVLAGAVILASSVVGFALDPNPGTSLAAGELQSSAVDAPCER